MADIDVGRQGGEPEIQPSARDEARAERRARQEAVSARSGSDVAAEDWARKNGLIKLDQKSFGPKPVAAPNELLEKVASAVHADMQTTDPVAALRADPTFMAAWMDKLHPGHGDAVRRMTAAHMSEPAPGDPASRPAALQQTQTEHNADQNAIFSGAPLTEPEAARALNNLNIDWNENGEPASAETVAKANGIIAAAVAESGMPQAVLSQLVFHGSRPGGVDVDAAIGVMDEYADKLGEAELQRRVSVLDKRLSANAKKLLAACDLDFSPSATRELLEWAGTL